MREMILRLTFAFLLCLLLAVSALATSSRDRHFRTSAENVLEKEMEVEVGASLFNTSAYFDFDGKEEEMTTDSAYQKMDVDALLRYGVGERLEVRGGLRYRQNHSETTATDLYNDGLESYMAGFKYKFDSSDLSWNYAVDGFFRQTAYSNVEYTTTVPSDEIVLGDHGSSYGLGFHMGYRQSSGSNVSLFAGFHSPPNHLSPEVIYDMMFRMHGNSLGLFVGVNGVYSMGMDDFADEPTRKPDLATGVTNLYNSVNRDWFSPYGGLELAMGKWKASVMGRMVMLGTSTDKGMEIAGKLTWNSFGPDRDREAKITKFKEYSAEAEVIKISPRQTFVKINQGTAGDFEKGMKVDIYKIDYVGGNVLVASGYVYEAHTGFSIVRLTKKFQKKMEIREGMVARGY